MVLFPSIFKLIGKINFLCMILSLLLSEISNRKHIFSSSLDLFSGIFWANETNLNTSYIYHILEIFNLNLVNFNYSGFLRYLDRILLFCSKELDNLKLFSFIRKFSPKFWTKGTNTDKKQNKVNGSRPQFTIIFRIMISLFVILYHFEKLLDPKQYISFLKQLSIFLIRNPIMPQFSSDKSYPLYSISSINENAIIRGVGFVCENESIDQGRSYEEMNIDVFDCFFSRYLTYSGKGGVIYVNDGSYTMSIIYSMFYNCVCSNEGGAIYFMATNSCLRMICANRCSASSQHFAILVASQMNQVEYLSVSNCSHDTSGYYSIYLETGDQMVDNTNSSMNNVIRYSGILIWTPSSFISTHCTLSNNNVTEWICLYFYSESGTVSMSYANIVHNNSPMAYGVVYVNGGGQIKMMNCIFQKNEGYLLCVTNSTLEVFHSFIDHSALSFSISTEVSTSNNTFTCLLTYQIQFFNSLHCNADIPLPQRTIDQTIRDTPQETIPRSYDEIICSNQIVDKREINVVFSFYFLYISYFQ